MTITFLLKKGGLLKRRFHEIRFRWERISRFSTVVIVMKLSMVLWLDVNKVLKHFGVPTITHQGSRAQKLAKLVFVPMSDTNVPMSDKCPYVRQNVPMSEKKSLCPTKCPYVRQKCPYVQQNVPKVIQAAGGRRSPPQPAAARRSPPQPASFNKRK